MPNFDSLFILHRELVYEVSRLVKYIEAFHGTQNLRWTLRHGIHPTHNSLEEYPENAAFLTTDFEEAVKYTRMHWGITAGGVVKVRVPESKLHLVAETEGWFDSPEFANPMIMPDSPRRGHIWFVVDAVIPPNYIVASYSISEGGIKWPHL